MNRYKIVTICALSILAVGLAMMCHEAAHVFAGRMAGGSPTLITTTEVQGDFESLSPAGFVALGMAGFIINTLFCALGWWILSRTPINAELQLLAWFFYAINGMLLTTAMISETLAGFGDWMTILTQLPVTTYLRFLVALLGVVGLIFMVRSSGGMLAKLVPDGDPLYRTAEARRIIFIGAVASAILVLGGSVANPIGTIRGILLALGAGLVPFIPMIFGTRFVSRVPSKNTTMQASIEWPWVLAATVITGVMWFIVGPGLMLP